MLAHEIGHGVRKIFHFNKKPFPPQGSSLTFSRSNDAKRVAKRMPGSRGCRDDVDQEDIPGGYPREQVSQPLA
jgi:hypothetical protein